MIHTAQGWWLAEAGAVEAAPALEGDVTADVVVIGGGYAGLWTAWQLLERGASVAVLEADVCGHGPSGRNGGFCETLWSNLPELTERFGLERALAAARASTDSVNAIGAWCEAQGVDAWFKRKGFLLASTTEPQDKVIDGILAAGAPSDRIVALDGAALRARCDSPRFRRGLLVPDDATVHPARLALGLRARVIERGARVFEHSRVKALRGTVAETAHGRVVAGGAVLAVNAAARGVAPLRHRLAVTSSHIVLTEPVPEAIERLGWTGGESITDARTFLHYFRTTNDDRIVFGWGGGRLAAGARLEGRMEVDPAVAEETRRHLHEILPATEGARITHAWGGPIDVSPSHLPAGRHARRRGRPGPVRVRVHRQRRRPLPPRRADHGRARRGETPDVDLPEADTVPVPPGAAGLGGRDGRARRLPAPRAPRVAGTPRRPADPGRLRGPARARHPRLALIRSETVMAHLGLSLLLLLPPRGE